MATPFEASTTTLFEEPQPSFSIESNDFNISVGSITLFLGGQQDGRSEDRHNECGGPFGFQFSLNTILIGIMCVLGLCGNTISILVLQKDRHNRVAVFLLQSLALADNSILCISFITLSVVYGLEHVVARDELFNYFKHIALKYTSPLGNIALSIGIWLTVLLAINRYIAVCRPFKAKRWLTMTIARVQVAVVVTLSVVLNIPRVFRYGNYIPCERNSSDCSGSELTDLARQKWFGIYYLNVFYAPVVSVLPLVLLVGFNVPLIRQMQKTKLRMKRNSLSYSGRQENNITIVMIVIILELIVFHTPDRIVHVVRSTEHTSDTSVKAPECPNLIYLANNLSNLLIVVNSSTNFIVYYICRRRFRRTLCQKLCCFDASNPSAAADQSPMPSEANGGSIHNIHSLSLNNHQRRRHKSPNEDEGQTISLRDRYRLTKKRDSNQICLLKVNGTCI